jgi:uncharacterized protein with HEPN domain
MSKRGDADLVEDILICLEKIKQYVSYYSYDDFLQEYKTQDAVIRNIEIIGEASKKISPELKNKYNSVPWKTIASTRDRLIHGYFGVNIDVVWEIATIDVPVLKQDIQKIKEELFG